MHVKTSLTDFGSLQVPLSHDCWINDRLSSMENISTTEDLSLKYLNEGSDIL